MNLQLTVGISTFYFLLYDKVVVSILHSFIIFLAYRKIIVSAYFNEEYSHSLYVCVGVASFPGCAVNRTACVALDQLLGALAYKPAVQKHLAQANYFRDPYMIPKYLAGDKFLADVNNERAPETTTASYGKDVDVVLCCMMHIRVF